MSILRNIAYSFRVNLAKNVKCTQRLLSSDPGEELPKDPKTGGYAKAFSKFEEMTEHEANEKPQTFVSLLRHSKFMDLGVAEGKLVIGKIFHIVDDDLYIDYGWKFHCVCPRPKKNSSNYIRGAKVRILIKELELSSKFLGYEKDLTLLEADCVLLGLVQERSKNV